MSKKKSKNIKKKDDKNYPGWHLGEPLEPDNILDKGTKPILTDAPDIDDRSKKTGINLLTASKLQAVGKAKVFGTGFVYRFDPDEIIKSNDENDGVVIFKF